MRLFSNLGIAAQGFRKTAWAVGAVVVVASLLAGCGGGGDETPPVTTGIVAGFTPSATPAAADLVRLEKVSSSGDKVTLAVVIDGPTSPDIYSYAFDLVIADVTVGKYVANSIVVGDMLVANTAQGQSLTAVASQVGDHVVIGVSKLGGGSGNDVPTGKKTIATLTFQLLKAGVTDLTFAASTGHANPAALDSTTAEIAAVLFDAQASKIQAN